MSKVDLCIKHTTSTFQFVALAHGKTYGRYNPFYDFFAAFSAEKRSVCAEVCKQIRRYVYGWNQSIPICPRAKNVSPIAKLHISSSTSLLGSVSFHRMPLANEDKVESVTFFFPKCMINNKFSRNFFFSRWCLAFLSHSLSRFFFSLSTHVCSWLERCICLSALTSQHSIAKCEQLFSEK